MEGNNFKADPSYSLQNYNFKQQTMIQSSTQIENIHASNVVNQMCKKIETPKKMESGINIINSKMESKGPNSIQKQPKYGPQSKTNNKTRGSQKTTTQAEKEKKMEFILEKPFDSLGKNQMSDYITYKCQLALKKIKPQLEALGVNFVQLDKPDFYSPTINDNYFKNTLKDSCIVQDPTVQQQQEQEIGELTELSSHNNLKWMSKYSISKMILSLPLRTLEFGTPAQNLKSQKFCPYCDWTKIQFNDYLNKKHKKKHLQKVHGKTLCELCDEALNNREAKSYHKKTQFCIANNNQMNKFLINPEYNSIEKQFMKNDPTLKLMDCCQQLIDSKNIQHACYYAHKLLFHGDFSANKYKVIIIENNQSIAQLTESQAKSLHAAGVLNVDCNGQFEIPQWLKTINTYLLCLTYEEEIRATITYKIVQINNQRISLVNKYTHSGKFCLDLAIIIYEMKALSERQRVTQIQILCEQESAWYFSRLSFFRCFSPIFYQEFPEMFQQYKNPILINLKTAESIRSLMHQFQQKEVAPASLKGNIQRVIINNLKEINLQFMLEKYLEIQLALRGDEKSQCALEKDQAITPDVVYQSIYNRIRVPKRKMFDLCLYKQNWDSKYDYNALLQNWTADVNFLNPPYSITTIFNTKQFIEFLKGQNIITLIPQISIENTFSSILFRLLGIINNLGSIAFVNYYTSLPTPVSLIYLLQPTFYDVLEYKKVQSQQKSFNKIMEQEPKKRQAVNLTDEKIDLSFRLLCSGVPIQEVHKLIGISPKTVRAVKEPGLSIFKQLYSIEQ